MKKIMVLSLLCLALTSCGDLYTEPVFTFKDPQPVGKKALSVFPDKLKGKYISQNQASTLSIYDSYIIKVSDYEFGIKKSDLESKYSISGDTLIDNNSGDRERIINRGDSVLAHFHMEDTIINLATGDILKKFKGYYFLNIGTSENGWRVTRLALTDGKLITAYISDSTALNKLNELAEKPLDTITQKYIVRKRKFKVLLKSNGFSDRDTFTKIR